MTRKLVEYKVYYTDGNIDHVNWQEAKKLVDRPPIDVEAVSRVTRWWHDDGELEREDEKFLFERR